MPNQIRVLELFESLQARLMLKLLAGGDGMNNILFDPDSDSNNAGHIIAGSLNYIHPTPVQVIGPTELQYLHSLPPKEYNKSLERLFTAHPATIILTRDVEPCKGLLEKAVDYKIPLLSSEVVDNIVLDNLQYYASKFLAPKTSLHGVFLEVLGSGILITGHSAVGKSELALELVTRGQTLIADDAPVFTKVAPDIVSGSCPTLLADMLEVRGLGVLDVRAMFGDSAIKKEKYLHLIIHLQRMKQSELAVMDRLQDTSHYREVLGVPVPIVTIPVAPGRNLAILLETAVRNHKLKRKGYNALEVFIERQQKAIEADNN